jgi:glycosyltransferase involved in cell wall biosynthesis
VTDDLQFGIESMLPAQLVAGRGNALLVHGWCFHPERRVRRLVLAFGDDRRPVLAHSMPRPDLEGDGFQSRSGFWAIAETGRVRAPERRALTLEAELSGGTQASADLGEIEVLPAIPTYWQRKVDPPETPHDVAVVAVCMPTYEPRLDLLEAQIESLRAQTHPEWHCIIVDDSSRPETVAAIEGLVDGDERFAVRDHQDRLGFYRNFERALTYVNQASDVVALCDQDDRWHPRKLEALVAELNPNVSLAYCDMRVTGAEGEEISPSYWSAVHRRNQHSDLDTLLVSNTITGAASVFRYSLLNAILPFPPAPGLAFHDQWIGLTALASGEVAYVPEALQDYVQHGGNVVLNVDTAWRHPAKKGIGPRLASWRRVYVNDVLQRAIFARVIELRCRPRLDRAERRAASRFAGADTRSFGFASVWRLSLSRRRRQTTGGLERTLALGLLWRKLAALRARFGRSREGRGGPLPVIEP